MSCESTMKRAKRRREQERGGEERREEREGKREKSQERRKMSLTCCISESRRDRLVLSLCVVSLMFARFQLDFTLLASDLKLHPDKLVTYFKYDPLPFPFLLILCCLLLLLLPPPPPSPRPLTRDSIADAGSMRCREVGCVVTKPKGKDSTGFMAKLTAPPTFPKRSRGPVKK
jgi:hypothetical protein